MFVDGDTQDWETVSFPTVDGELGLVNSGPLDWLPICISNILFNMVTHSCAVAFQCTGDINCSW